MANDPSLIFHRGGGWGIGASLQFSSSGIILILILIRAPPQSKGRPTSVGGGRRRRSFSSMSEGGRGLVGVNGKKSYPRGIRKDEKGEGGEMKKIPRRKPILSPGRTVS